MHTALSLTIRHDISVNITCVELIDNAHRRQLSAEKKNKGNKAPMRQTSMLAGETEKYVDYHFYLYPEMLPSCTYFLRILRDSAVAKSIY